MRIDNSLLNTVGTGAPVGATQKAAAQNAAPSTSPSMVARGDQATLSSAANLVALAKNATTAGRQAQIAGLTAQVQSGKYQGDIGQAGKGMVQELLQSNTSAAQR